MTWPKIGCPRIGGGEEGHRRAQLQRVDAAQDVVGGPAGVAQHRLGAFDQPGPEHGVRQIAARFGQVLDRVRLSHAAASEPRDLREDEPHPMAAFLPGAQLGQGLLVG